MNERKSKIGECGFVQPDLQLRLRRDQNILSCETVAVLVSLLSAIWIFCIIPFVSPADTTWIIAGAITALLPAIWLTLRKPKVIWKELKSEAMSLKGADLRRLYSSSTNLGVPPNIPSTHGG